MSKTLADIFGWEEGASYKVGELYYSVVGENLYYFKDFDSPRIKTNQDIIIDLLELVNEAERVEPKRYYLKHKFLGSEDFNYLNLRIDGTYSIIDILESSAVKTQFTDSESVFKTKFTEEEIEKIEASGFDLCNFEKVEVEDE